MRAAWAEVSLDQIRKNVRYLMGRTTPPTKLMGVVKANGYGHGVIPVARVLEAEGASYFAVAIPQEGIELRDAGFREPILILGRYFDEDYPLVLEYDLMPAIFSTEQARVLNEGAAKAGKIASVHIKIDTGMARLGFVPGPEAMEEIARIAAMPNIRIEGIFSHFATASSVRDDSYCRGQFAKFTSFTDELEAAGIKIPLKHISNSAAAILYPEMQLDMVRPGMAVYGLYAGPEFMGLPGVEVYPAMEIKAKLASVKRVPSGTKVGYDGTFETKRESLIGVVPMGYVDGVRRSLGNKGAVLLHGRRCPIVGKVCMDQFMIDITDLDDPRENDEVVIIGRQEGEYISAEEFAESCGSVSIEVLCQLGRRMPLVYK